MGGVIRFCCFYQWLMLVALSSLIWNVYMTHLLFSRNSQFSINHPSLDYATFTTSTPRLQYQHNETTINNNVDSKLRPDWRYACDCSVWDNMCRATTLLQNRYKKYPFPISKSRHNTYNLDDFDHKPMSNVPKEWLDALNVDNSIDKPPSRPISYIYPPQVDKTRVLQCINDLTNDDFSWKMQIDKLLDSKRVIKEHTTHMVAFTISDYNYAYDMMHDVFEMTSNIVGFHNSFFLVAIDYQTLEMACTYGYPVVAWDSAKPKGTTDLGHDVANTKFEVSLYLASKSINFFFYEMDVWFVTSPKELIASYHANEGHDMLLSSHMRDPKDINIGVYSVTSNERTIEFFEICINIAKQSPDTHDQWVMGQLLYLAWAINETGTGFKLTKMWKPPPKDNPPTMLKPPRWGLWRGMEIMAGEQPIPVKNTIAIHTLCKGPLRRPFGKKILAKELGVWYGAGGYYSKTGTNRRYLWMDGHDSPNTYNTVQNFEWDVLDSKSFIFNDVDSFRWTMATLLALARRTGRIFQMPTLLSDLGAHYLWTIMDFEPVEEMGIDFRETNFPYNKKAWHSEAIPFQSVARTALAPIKTVDKESTMYVQYPNSKSAEEGTIKAWRFDDNMREEKALDAWWAMHTAIPEVDSAELLLVNPHFISWESTRRLKSKMERKKYKPTVAEKEIFDIYTKLKWCPSGDPKSVVVRDDIVGRSSAERACYGKGHPYTSFAP